MIGSMAMPMDFKYSDVFAKGYPQHHWTDRFRLKHPAMDNSRRAKIFSPFDALKGFNEAVAAKEVLYESKHELDDGDKAELDRRLNILHNLTYNSRMARRNRIIATITYYLPCTDKNNDAYGYRGQYITLTGIVWKVSPAAIKIDDTVIALKNVVAVEGKNLFDVDWELDAP